MLPRGGFLRGRVRFVGQGEISRCWQAHLAGRPQLRRPTGLLVMGQGRGRREEGEGDGTYAGEAKIAGV
jgi:hypothetical protein